MPDRSQSSAPSPLIEALGLQPHPEGGWFRETWRSDVPLRPDGYDGERASATAIYFLLGPGDESRWHVVRSAEIWLWHSGSPLRLQLGGTEETPGDEPVALTLGADVAGGERPQAVVPPGTWQRARPADRDGETLVSCVVSPGFDFADFRLLP
ncbi:cupin domain-containing protein [Streptomyces winkii]|uniref:cupin domain-containing protein n=1 Tax=Streptomyces winkii TaxID=3051178 RepID=UPI0028D340F8|nr:cupin domain-containing protein [Streptomyces sp. DSM 40971]